MTGVSVAALALNACGDSASPSTTEEETTTPASETPSEPQQGGTLRVAFSDSPTNLDPAVVVSAADVTLGAMFYNKLTFQNEGLPGSPVTPNLAESWEVSEDARAHTFYLRQGVTFQHGTPFTAVDVVHTIERILNPDSGISVGSALPPIAELEIVDDYTVRFNLENPNVSLPFILGNSGFDIVPHDRTTEQLQEEPSGTGPFRLVEYIPGEQLVMQRNEDYWNPALPYLDEVQIYIIPERSTQIASLSSGSIDWVVEIGVENLPSLTTLPNVKIHEGVQGIFPVFAMNVTESPFDDVRVRQAFKHAINREALTQVILQDHGTVHNDQPVPPTSIFSADIPPLAYDPERARELLSEAGYADGVEVTLSISEIVPRILDTAIAMQEMFKAANITMTLNRVPVSNYWAEEYLQASFFVSFWNANSEPDIQLTISQTSEGSYNESSWSTPETDALIAEARGLTDTEERQAAYAQIQEIISREGGVIIPYIAPLLSASGTNVYGIVTDNTARMTEVWVTDA